MSITRLHLPPKLTRERRAWLKSLQPGDQVIMCSANPAEAAAAYGECEWESAFVLARSKDQILISVEGATLEFNVAGEWRLIERDEDYANPPDSWIISAADDDARTLRLVLAAAKALAQISAPDSVFYERQLRRSLSLPVEADAHKAALRLMRHAQQLVNDIDELQTSTILTDASSDPLHDS